MCEISTPPLSNGGPYFSGRNTYRQTSEPGETWQNQTISPGPVVNNLQYISVKHESLVNITG